MYDDDDDNDDSKVVMMIMITIMIMTGDSHWHDFLSIQMNITE